MFIFPHNHDSILRNLCTSQLFQSLCVEVLRLGFDLVCHRRFQDFIICEPKVCVTIINTVVEDTLRKSSVKTVDREASISPHAFINFLDEIVRPNTGLSTPLFVMHVRTAIFFNIVLALHY